MSETVVVIETATEVVEVVTPGTQGPPGEGVPAGGTTGQALVKASDDDFDTEWGEGGGGATEIDELTDVVITAVQDADRLEYSLAEGAWVNTAAAPVENHASSHEDGGTDEVSLQGLSGTPAALQAHLDDATDAHPGSAITNTPAGNIAATTVQAAINELDSEKAASDHAHAGEDITSGTVADARIASTIARDSEVTAAVSAHEADTTSVHGIADTSVLATDTEVATAVSDHSADTTSVHGVADTSALALTANHPTNATFNDHSARHENGGADEISVAGLSGELADAQKIAILDDGTPVASRAALNFHEGSNVTLTIADDSGNGEVDITIASSGGGGSANPEDESLIVAMEVFA